MVRNSTIGLKKSTVIEEFLSVHYITIGTKIILKNDKKIKTEKKSTKKITQSSTIKISKKSTTLRKKIPTYRILLLSNSIQLKWCNLGCSGQKQQICWLHVRFLESLQLG